MSQYRKRPIVVDAWQWTFDDKCEPSPDWVNDAINKRIHDVGAAEFWPDGNHGLRNRLVPDRWSNEAHIAIHTLEGWMIAQPMDWIIKGIRGELYPCKPDIFAETYEPLNPKEPQP